MDSITRWLGTASPNFNNFKSIWCDTLPTHYEQSSSTVGSTFYHPNLTHSQTRTTHKTTFRRQSGKNWHSLSS
eukprot:4715640-Amphidinium_carterae.1